MHLKKNQGERTYNQKEWVFRWYVKSAICDLFEAGKLQTGNSRSRNYPSVSEEQAAFLSANALSQERFVAVK